MVLSLLGGNAYAAAAEVGSPKNAPGEVNSETVSAQEEQLADDLEVLFTEYIPQKDGAFTVIEEAVIRDGYADSMGVLVTAAGICALQE
ncbi:hypothetical protein [Corynebacterium pseudotuberculosis]|nr:hypothetical protein [Corynebacterium pseudotuberculosis]WFP67289.1 hypothetical protein P8128_00465 [Corynebacterium pseudotuberculosis]